MFLKEVHLTPNHWSFKLLQWTFPSIGRFHNFCPHFWLTILSLVIFPLTVIFKILKFILLDLIGPVLSKVIDAWEAFLDLKFLRLNELNQDIAWASDRYHDNWIYDYKYNKYQELFMHLPECEKRKIRKFRKWLYSLPEDKRKEFDQKIAAREQEVDKKLKELAEYYRQRNEKETLKRLEKERKHEEVRKLKEQREPSMLIPRMMLVGKILVIIILVPLAIIVAVTIGYWLIMGLGWVWYWIVYAVAHTDWMAVLGVFGIAAAVIGIIVLLFLFFKWIGSKIGNSIEDCDKIRARLKLLSIPFIPIFKTIGWLAMGFIDAVGFLWTGIKTFKSKNCPAIIWEEKKK